MIHGKSSVNSKAVEREDSAYISGSGYASSNDLETARILSEELTKSVDYCNRVAYEIQRRK